VAPFFFQDVTHNGRECEQVSKKRLYKSSNVVIGGVCGGIAEYFDADPTLVRIIAVALLIVAWGVPAIVYVALLLVMPPDPAAAQGYVDARVETKGSQGKTDGEGFEAMSSQVGWSNPSTSPTTKPDASVKQAPPPPDPTTRVTASSYHTVGDYPQTNGASSASSRVTNVADSVKSNPPLVLVLGAVLIGVGVIALLSNFVHISLWRFWPVVLVVVGLVCLFTPGSRGWSLERAGNSIVLIAVGLALLAWMLQLIQTRVFIAAFIDLWPIFLVVLGLVIIGSARKSSIFNLAGSLVLAATIVFGLWVYGGLEWESVRATSLLSENDGFQELIWDITHSR